MLHPPRAGRTRCRRGLPRGRVRGGGLRRRGHLHRGRGEAGEAGEGTGRRHPLDEGHRPGGRPGLGASRPGHFRGVATVVAKLLAASEPDEAFFGQKDAAQVAVLQRMVRDLCLPVGIVVCPIVRDADGLALSSRNAYLSQVERKQALTLSRAVRRVEALVEHGERRADALIAAARATFAVEPEVRVDYVELVNWETLERVEIANPGSLFAVAAFVGKTRLIDNAVLS